MKFWEKVGQIFSKGLGEIGQELGRMGVQGSAELGSALFTGNAYVPYGQGQNRGQSIHSMEGLHGNDKEMQHENDGRSM
jgi:hypothetical protein